MLSTNQSADRIRVVNIPSVAVTPLPDQGFLHVPGGYAIPHNSLFAPVEASSETLNCNPAMASGIRSVGNFRHGSRLHQFGTGVALE
jgi:hypothetical protein